MHMKKFAVTWVRGDDTGLLKLCETREDAMTAKRLLEEKYNNQDVHFAVFYGNVDERGSLIMDSHCRMLF